jgi:uncharacterized membrane protein YccC
MVNRPKRKEPSRMLRAVGAGAVVVGAVLALWLKQPGWVFLIVAGVIVYNGGRLPRPHR